MKTFKYKFTKLITAFIWAGMALAVAAFAMNTYFVFSEGLGSAANIVYPIIRFVLIIHLVVKFFLPCYNLLV